MIIGVQQFSLVASSSSALLEGMPNAVRLALGRLSLLNFQVKARASSCREKRYGFMNAVIVTYAPCQSLAQILGASACLILQRVRVVGKALSTRSRPTPPDDASFTNGMVLFAILLFDENDLLPFLSRAYRLSCF